MMRKISLILAAVVFSTTTAFGVLDIPDLPGLGVPTIQEWGFDNDQDIPGNTFQSGTTFQMNPFAQGPLMANIGGDMFYPGLDWENGVWTGNAITVTMDIPNNPVRNPFKVIIVETKIRGDVVLEWVEDDMGIKHYNPDRIIEDLGNGWKIVTDIWEIQPNPFFEKLCYGINSDTLDQVSMDYINVYTECIPEPATMSLLGLGMCVLMRRKK